MQDTTETNEVFPSSEKDYTEDIYQELKSKRDSKEKEKEVSTLGKLDRKHMLTILLFLKHNRPAIKTEIYSNISRNINMIDKLNTLEEMGLIGMYNTFDSNTCYVILTDKGEKVAQQLEDMIETIDTMENEKPQSIYTYYKETQRERDE